MGLNGIGWISGRGEVKSTLGKRNNLESRICENDVARTTLWAWLYFISSCTSEESVDITLVYEDDKTNWPTKSSFAFFVIYDQLE